MFISVYQKTNPLQTLHGVQFSLSQSQTNDWIHRLLPVLQHAWRDLGHAPERDAHRVAASPLVLESTPALAIDGTERRRQRPQDAARQQEHSSGKKKTPTDKNILLVNAHTRKVVSLGPTVAGKTHDKTAVDDAPIAYPANATLDKDSGFQGYEPPGVLTRQPKKTQRPRVERRGDMAQQPNRRGARCRRTRDRRGQAVSDGQRCPAPDPRRHV